MPQKIYIVEGRQFRTEADQKLARKDKELMERLEEATDFKDRAQLEKLLQELKSGKHHFYTILGEDFREKVEDALKQCRKAQEESGRPVPSGRKGKTADTGDAGLWNGRKDTKNIKNVSSRSKIETSEKTKEDLQEEALIEKMAREELKKREIRRKRVAYLCFLLGSLCILYFAIYFLRSQRAQNRFHELAQVRERGQEESKEYGKGNSSDTERKESVKVNLDSDEVVLPDILDQYKNLYISNKKLIGWLKIDDTRIDYPVMQTSDNEYYLKHNIDQKEDKNGALFLDKDCKAYPQSTNLIIYGHHMQSGVMFGTLDKYASKDFYEKHKVIEFDTIYEEGLYDVMYVFRSKIYNEDDMVFKYYQFTEALSEQEFDSYMTEMASISLYDTGVTAQYGDHLLTLSTCDYYVKDGRFVVVAKKRE